MLMPSNDVDYEPRGLRHFGEPALGSGRQTRFYFGEAASLMGDDAHDELYISSNEASE